ncbi:abortive infection protein [Natronobacterium lacisalsi]|uniref:abortive infection protein n=1 Tax=Natronobacterium lacisalsi TaxID=229731 RepID=UPI001EE6DA98|nr:abortive infection protein [Halobiforma lacisalsi]
MTTAVDGRKTGLFLALAFGISWTGAAGLFLSGIELNSTLGTVLVVLVFMWAPAIAAIVVQRWAEESVRAGCGLSLGRLRWVLLALVAPVGLLAATIGVGLVVPDVSLTTDYAAFGAPRDRRLRRTRQVRRRRADHGR